MDKFCPNFRNRYSLLLVLLLLISQAAAVAAIPKRFIDNKDGTIKDTTTGLTWVKDPEQVPSMRGPLIWVSARDGCRDLVYAGAGPNAWRLPNIGELQSLISDGTSSPRIDIFFFNSFAANYWSATDYTGPGAYVWIVDFARGETGASRKLNLLSPELQRARCVRS